MSCCRKKSVTVRNYLFGVNAASSVPVVETAPVISGLTTLGAILSCTPGTWANNPTSYSYQWNRNGSPIPGATNNSYTTVVTDSLANITCTVIATNATGSSLPAESNTLVMGDYTPVNTVAPSISGNAVVGQMLSVTNGTWTNSPTGYTYQWKRNGADIAGATNNTYTLVQADAGNTSNISCLVTASNGLSATASSNVIARILDQLTNNYITGLTLTSAEINSFNMLYLDIRANGYHTEIDSFLLYASASQTAANKSLFGSNIATPVNSPTWTRAVGYTMTGTSYINRGTSTNVKFTRNDHVLMTGVSNKNTLQASAAPIGGMTTGSAFLYIDLASAGNVKMSSCAAGENQNVFTRTIANQDYAIRRTASTGYTPYQDGVAGTAQTQATSGTPPTLLYEGAYNNNGVAASFFENGARVKYSLQGSSVINPITMRTIINNFIASL